MNKHVAETVLARAAGHCECCGRPMFDSLKDRATIDHWRGRARAESVATCWVLRAECHRDRTDNHPSAAYWTARYGVFCVRHGYLEELGQALEELSWRAAKRTTA